MAVTVRDRTGRPGGARCGGRRWAALALMTLLALSATATGGHAYSTPNAVGRYKAKLLGFVRELWMDAKSRTMKVEFLKAQLNKNEVFQMGQDLTQVVAMKKKITDIYTQTADPQSKLNVFQALENLVKIQRMNRHLENYVQIVIEHQMLDPAGTSYRRTGSSEPHVVLKTFEKENNVSVAELVDSENDSNQINDAISAIIETFPFKKSSVSPHRPNRDWH